MTISKTLAENKGQAATCHRSTVFAPVLVKGQEALSVNPAGSNAENMKTPELKGAAEL